MKPLLLTASSLLLAITATAGRLSDLAACIHYTPPTNFYGGVVTHPRTDPGDNPLSLTSPEFLEYSDPRSGSHVIFSFALIGAYVGDGKVVHFLPVTPSLMTKEIEAEYKGKFPYITPASFNLIHGLTAVNLTAVRPAGEPRFLRSCWIQVETNLALKITALASDTPSFTTTTNSLNTISIDKPTFLATLYAKPKDAGVITNHLQRVELGHAQQGGYTYPVCVLYTKERIYSLPVGQTSHPSEDLNGCKAAFGSLRDLSGLKNVLRTVVIDSAPDVPQTSLFVVAETNPAPSAAWIGNIRSPNLFFPAPVAFTGLPLAPGIPQGFFKEAAYIVDAPLYLRKQPGPDD
jgi:hypothetical protein